MNQSVRKARLRGELLERRREMPFEEVFSLSAAVQKRFLETPLFRGAASIALYSSFQNEVLTDEIFQRAITAGKEVCYPRVLKGAGRLAFIRVREVDDLAPGSYDIKEPLASADEADPGRLDLVVVPGAAFDLRGGRLGYGKGYYDRALAGVICPIVALAYDFQVLALEIPMEPHDVKVSHIVTEKRTVVTVRL